MIQFIGPSVVGRAGNIYIAYTPHEHNDVVIVQKLKREMFAVCQAMTSCCDLMYISVFVRLYCFYWQSKPQHPHTHARTHMYLHTRYSPFDCPFLSLMVKHQERLCFGCVMANQANNLLDATMNIDAIDWKSDEEIKCHWSILVLIYISFIVYC